MSIPSALQPFIPHEEKAWNRLAVSLGMFVLGVVFASWASRIPDIKASLQLSDAALGMALFAAPIGQFPSMLVTPKLVKRFGSRAMVILGMLGYPLMLVLLGWVNSYGMLFATLVVFGALNSLLNIAVNTQAIAVENRYKRSIMAKFHGCWSLGGVIGGFIGGALAGIHVHSVVHFALIFLLALAITWFTSRHLMREDPDAQVAHTGLTRHRWVLPDLLLVLLGIIGFGAMAVEGSMYDWNSVYFVSVLHEEGFSARLGYLMCMIAMVSARFIADGFINRYGEVLVLRISAFSMTLGLALIVFFPQLIPAMIGSGLVGFGMAAVVPICYSMAGRSERVSPSAAISMVSAISFFGFLLGPPVIGTISEHLGLRGAFAVVMGAPLIVLLLSAKLKSLIPQR